LYDVKGRFTIHGITPEEASYNLLKVRQVALGAKGIPHIVTHDGRTIRYPDPAIRVNGTVKFDLEQGKIVDFVRFDDYWWTHTLDRTFATRYVILWVSPVCTNPITCSITNIFIIGEGNKRRISLPRGRGIKLTISEERDLRRKRAAEQYIHRAVVLSFTPISLL